jgi:hypothetical protein
MFKYFFQNFELERIVSAFAKNDAGTMVPYFFKKNQEKNCFNKEKEFFRDKY